MTNNIAANFSAGISGEYRLVITKPDGSTSDTGWFTNLILDSGLDRLGNGGGEPIFNYCRVGTGSTAPLNTQSALDAQIASTAAGAMSDTSSTNIGSPTYVTTHVFTCSFAQGSVVGNITEVGIGWRTTGNTLFSRALILDSSSSPISLTLTTIDQLTVYYRLKIVPPLTDSIGTVSISGTSYEYTTRVSNVDSFGLSQYLFTYDYFSSPGSAVAYGSGTTLGAITGTLIGGQLGGPTFSSLPYTDGNFYKDSTLLWSSSAVQSPIQGIAIKWGATYQSFGFQIVFTTLIPKSNTNTLTLTMRFSWGRTV